MRNSESNDITRRDLIYQVFALVGVAAAGCMGLGLTGRAAAQESETVMPMAYYERVKIAYTECIYRMDHPDPSLRNTSYEAYPVYKDLAFPNGYTVTKSYTETQDDELCMTFRRWTLTYHIY